MMDCSRPSRRACLKAHGPNWKEKLRQNCLERAKEDRAHLIWKIRSSAQNTSQKEIIKSAFRDIVSDELKKIEKPSNCDTKETLPASVDELLWEYNGMQVDSCSNNDEHDELLIDMERLLYEDLRKELIRRELDAYEEEEEYLSQAVFEQMQLNEGQLPSEFKKDNRVWCPVCKQGELRENHHIVYCSRCELQLDLESDKVNLDVLRDRLGEAYQEHLDKGCKATPRFCMEARFKITALYIQCQVCQTFEIIL